MPTTTAREQRQAARNARRRNQRLIAGAGVLAILLIVVLIIFAATSADRRAGQLQIEDLSVGIGPEAQTGNTVSVHYTGWLEDGTQFDSSLERGEPYEFTLGQRRVIEGWEQGVTGMRAGGVRRLTIPPALAYGANGRGPIPPNATLVFEIELLEIK